MHKFKVRSGGVDGVVVEYLDGFYFDTYAEMMEFIEGVEKLEEDIKKKYEIDISKVEVKL